MGAERTELEKVFIEKRGTQILRNIQSFQITKKCITWGRGDYNLGEAKFWEELGLYVI